MFVISRFEFYKHSECAAVFAESERTLARYDNPDWNPDKVRDNIHLVEPTFSGTIDDYILSLKKEYKCRMSVDPSLPRDKQTNVLCQCLFTASPDFFEGMTEEEIINYFRCCLSFLQSELPESSEIISAVIHRDETNYHMHVNFLPIIEKENAKGKLKTVFSTSEIFKGKDYFSGYQDRFYQYMNDRYTDMNLDRKGEVHQDHLTVREYKKVASELGKLVEVRNHLVDQCNQANENLDTLEQMAADIKKKPAIQMQIENANLKRELSLYKRFIEYLKKRFPQLEPLFHSFEKGKVGLER